MKYRGGYTGTLILTAALLLMLGSCRTTISFDAVIPAEVNMSEHRTIGVFDFTEYSRSPYLGGAVLHFGLFPQQLELSYTIHLLLPEQVASHMTSSMVRTLQRTNYFTVVPPRQLSQYAHDIPPKGTPFSHLFGIDAFIIGSVDDMNVREYLRRRGETVTDPDTGKKTTVLRDYLVQEVYLEVSYRVVSAEDGSTLGVRRLDGRKSRETRIPLPSEMPSGWSTGDFRAPEVSSLFRSIIDDFQPEIREHLAPRTVRQYRTLERDRTGDPRMDRADTLIQEGLQHEALRLYLQVWYETGNFAAAYNAAILHEMFGEVNKAVSLMREAAARTGERNAFRELERLLEVQRQYYRALEQM